MNKYFVYDKENGIETFKTEQEQLDYAKNLINDCRNEEWDEEVEDIICGIITHITHQCNVKKRPGMLVDGYDEAGFCWPDDMDYICDYEMVKIW